MYIHVYIYIYHEWVLQRVLRLEDSKTFPDPMDFSPGFPEDLPEDLRLIVEEEQKRVEDEPEARESSGESTGNWELGTGNHQPNNQPVIVDNNG